MAHQIDPDLDPGLTLLSTTDPRSRAVHDLALAALETGGEAYWLDARNTAATYALEDAARNGRHLRRLRVARAFTAYQHHTLVREVVRETTPRTALVVAPNVDALYADADLADWEARDLLDATLTCLSELATAADLSILLTTAGDSRGDPGLTGTCHERADAVVECRETRFGHAFDGPGVEQTGYRCGRFWQTTIPYWADLCGTVEAFDVPTDRVAGPAWDQRRVRLEG